MKGGIPSSFYEDVFEFPYNRLDKLEELMAAHGRDRCDHHDALWSSEP
jgi:hypothetical protein